MKSPQSSFDYDDPKKIYGKNRFWCNSFCVSGSKFYHMFYAFFLISLPYVTMIVVLIKTKNIVSITFPIIFTSFFYIIEICSGILGGCTDPGILPRQGDDFYYNTNKPLLRQVINGHLMTLTFCYSCSLFRPPRTSHCSLCDNCIERFDHHCVWLGTCIGRRNYKYFYTLIFCLNISSIFQIIFSMYYIIFQIKKFKNKENYSLLLLLGLSGVALVNLLYLVFFIAKLFFLHTYLVFSSMTFYEYFKDKFKKIPKINPFKNKIFGTWSRIIFSLSHKSFLVSYLFKTRKRFKIEEEENNNKKEKEINIQKKRNKNKEKKVYLESERILESNNDINDAEDSNIVDRKSNGLKEDENSLNKNNNNNNKIPRSNSTHNLIMININKLYEQGRVESNFRNQVINFLSSDYSENAENENEENEKESEDEKEAKDRDNISQEEDLKFNNSFNVKGIGFETYRRKNQKNKYDNEEEKENNKDIEKTEEINNENNEEQQNKESLDNDKTDINFEDINNTNTIINNNHTTKTINQNKSNATQSHKLSKKKSGIVISDEVDEDEDDGVIFRNRGRVIYNKDNVSEETNPNFDQQD